MKEKLLEYLSGKYIRESSDYIMKSAGVSWILRIKYKDDIKRIIIYGNIKKIKYESYTYFISNYIPTSFLQSIFDKQIILKEQTS